jgi:hypothetical protein
MIFAEMEYPGDCRNLHEELKAFLYSHFSRVESGLQLDSWFWIHDGAEKVALDTFSSIKHQIKSASAGTHVDHVISALRLRYPVRMYSNPELEAHEEA